MVDIRLSIVKHGKTNPDGTQRDTRALSSEHSEGSAFVFCTCFSGCHSQRESVVAVALAFAVAFLVVIPEGNLLFPLPLSLPGAPCLDSETWATCGHQVGRSPNSCAARTKTRPALQQHLSSYLHSRRESAVTTIPEFFSVQNCVELCQKAHNNFMSDQTDQTQLATCLPVPNKSNKGCWRKNKYPPPPLYVRQE